MCCSANAPCDGVLVVVWSALKCGSLVGHVAALHCIQAECARRQVHPLWMVLCADVVLLRRRVAPSRPCLVTWRCNVHVMSALQQPLSTCTQQFPMQYYTSACACPALYCRVGEVQQKVKPPKAPQHTRSQAELAETERHKE